jgi:hypothetical protein
MKAKTVALAALATFAVAPIAGQAAPAPKTAFNACVKAFVSAYLPGRIVHTTKANDSGQLTTLSLTQNKYTIALTARGVDTGTVLAEARCVADGKGIVLVLDQPATLDYVARADFRADIR